MTTQVSAGYGFSVHETGEGIMLSRDQSPFVVAEGKESDVIVADWMRGMDYLVYSQNGKIYISPGTAYDHAYLTAAYETPLQTIEGFATGDSGYIYLEIPKFDTQGTASVGIVTTGTIAIGGSDYYFGITVTTESTFVGPTLIAATIGAYSASMPSDKDFYRKELATFSISAEGSIFIEQKHIGSVHLPVAIQTVPTQFAVAIA